VIDEGLGGDLANELSGVYGIVRWEVSYEDFNFTVRVTAALGGTDTQALSLTIQPRAIKHLVFACTLKTPLTSPS
jgi:hypothetical protein